ncbi:MAG: hypothetical protein ACYDAG_14475 [Chloroflexota bacterium]
MPTKPVKDKVEGKLHEVKGAARGSKTEELMGKAQGAKGKLEGNASSARKTTTAKRP